MATKTEMPQYEWAKTRHLTTFPEQYALDPPPGDGWALASELLAADGIVLVCIWCRVKQ